MNAKQKHVNCLNSEMKLLRSTARHNNFTSTAIDVEEIHVHAFGFQTLIVVVIIIFEKLLNCTIY